VPHFEKKNILWQRAAHFLDMRSSLLESVIVTEFQATEAHSSLDLTREKYSISIVDEENLIL
jgi:hypothetical protein